MEPGNSVDDKSKPTGTFSYFDPPIAKAKGKPDIPSGVATIASLFNEITSGRHQIITERLKGISDPNDRRKYKSKYFPYVTPNGTCSQRHQDFFNAPSGYFIIDFDDLNQNLEAVRERLIRETVLPVVLLFKSPSQNGLKLLLNIDPALIDHDCGSNKMHKFFSSTNCYLAQNYSDIIKPDEKGNFIDPSGKDLLRTCFIPNDPFAYLNANVTTRIDNDFVQKYYPVAKLENSSRRKIVSPRTTIDDLADRHLIKENHHPQLLSFISSCHSIGHSKETVLAYIDRNIKISPESAHANRNKLEKEIDDIYNRYPTSSERTALLNPLIFFHDIFLFKWNPNAEDFILHGLYYEGVRQLLRVAGFWKKYDGNKNSIFIQEVDNILTEVTSEIMRDHLNDYIGKIGSTITFQYQGKTYYISPSAAREFFLKNSNNIFNQVWLEHLQIHGRPILKDTDKEIFVIFKNSYITITSTSICQRQIGELREFCIWNTQQIDRDFTLTGTDWRKSKFGQFLNNISDGDEKNLKSVQSLIGYLMHNYTRLSEGQAILLYDKAITDIKNPMGGTGKGLIANALKQIRNVAKIDGKHLNESNRFKLERIKLSTQIAWFDDVKNDFDFSMLHSNLTDGWTIERKYLPQLYLEPKHSPKALICSNTIIKGGGTTNIRRQFVFELGDYYSSKIKTGLEKPIEELHGGIFFSEDWPKEEWDCFYSLMCACGQLYLSGGLIPQTGGNVKLNRFRQTTSDDFVNWCQDQNFTPDEEKITKSMYKDFASAYYGDNFERKLSQRTFTRWLTSFAEYNGWAFKSRKSNGNILFSFQQAGNSD